MSSQRKPSHGMSAVTSSRRSGEETPRARTSYFTDQNDVPLARLVTRRERFARLASSWTWSRETSSEGPSSARSIVDASFQNKMLEGLNHRVPERSSQALKDRMAGTMTMSSKDTELPRSVEDVRRRQEHVEGRLVQMPVLLTDTINADSAMRGMSIVRNAVLSELRDLYRIVSSLDARKFDIGASDIRAMFEWFGTLENFVRLYLTASEQEIYIASQVDDWANLQGSISKATRKKAKKRIIELSDKVEAMKRKMIAEDKKCAKDMDELHKRVDDFTMCLVRFLNEEVEQIPCLLESKFPEMVVEKLFRNMVSEMQSTESGREMIVLMSRGLGMDSNKMASWVRDMCGAGTKVAVTMWMRKFIDRHTNYAILFEKAEEEYRQIYEELSSQVDDEIAGIHEDFERKMRISPQAAAQN